jgi:hypothetical protein
MALIADENVLHSLGCVFRLSKRMHASECRIYLLKKLRIVLSLSDDFAHRVKDARFIRSAFDVTQVVLGRT